MTRADSVRRALIEQPAETLCVVRGLEQTHAKTDRYSLQLPLHQTGQSISSAVSAVALCLP
jgi:hypothetical protein